MSPLLIFAFIVMTVLCFGVVLFMMRPTPDQKAVVKRLTAIKTKQGEFASVNDRLDTYLKPTEKETYQWLADMFETLGWTEKLQTLIMQANRGTTVSKIMMSSLLFMVIGGGVTMLFTKLWFVALPAALLGAALPFLVLKFQKMSRLKAFEKNLADCIDMMARSLRAGHSVVAAIGIVAEQAPEPARFEFGEVFKKQNYGLPLREAMMQMLDRVPSQDLRVLVTGILVQKDTGGNLAEILDRITHVIRDRVRIKGEIKTHTAQGRMTGYILCALPIVMLLLINMVNPGYSSVLFDTDTGHKILGVGIGLLTVGGLIIRQIINGIEV